MEGKCAVVYPFKRFLRYWSLTLKHEEFNIAPTVLFVALLVLSQTRRSPKMGATLADHVNAMSRRPRTKCGTRDETYRWTTEVIFSGTTLFPFLGKPLMTNGPPREGTNAAVFTSNAPLGVSFPAGQGRLDRPLLGKVRNCGNPWNKISRKHGHIHRPHGERPSPPGRCRRSEVDKNA